MTDGPSIAIIGSRGYPSFYGGFETLVRHLAPHLVDQGWDVDVYCRREAVVTDHPGHDPRVRQVFTPGWEAKSFSTLSYGLTSVGHTARRRHDVAFVMNVANGYWLPLLRARTIPSVVNVDGIEWEREKWSAAGRKIFFYGARATARFADHIVTDSRAIADRWREEFGREGTTIPYGGTAVAALPLVEDLTPGRYALLVARLVPENSIGEFLSAAEALSEKWDVVIVGSSGYGGELEERVRRLAATRPRVHWLGHISDDDRLFALWQHAGVYFHGHSVGGTNPALVQAMACGTPVVARDTVYNREVLGTTGAFVPPEPAAIHRALDRVLADPALQDQMRQAARARQQRLLTWEQVVRDYERVFREALAKRSAELHMGTM
ncbi:glycosyltransferase [Ornithinicoccus halotolerans]|uniref:glycosyltransferase n=1 Tax=Ornithinicoccus halotolerans TaxID=1748220 RepID=UPI001E304DFE|nr:glycosyltransferase [Ornithinicoccus halotolerans]